jgi:hypothetical protein
MVSTGGIWGGWARQLGDLSTGLQDGDRMGECVRVGEVVVEDE